MLKKAKEPVVQADVPEKALEAPRYWHISQGRAYGPSLQGETLPEYKARVKRAYGSLRGVIFGKREDLNPSYFCS